MSHQRKTWQEKLADNKDLLQMIDIGTSKRGGTSTFVIPAPKGHQVIQRGKRFFVPDFQQSLADLNRD